MLEIDFYGQPLGPDHTDEIIKTFQSTALLNEDKDIILDLSCTLLTDDCITQLEQLFLTPRLIEVRLDTNQLTAVGLTTLLSFFSKRTNPVLSLSLSQNPLNEQGAQVLSAFLPKLALQHLHLRQCGINDVGASLIASSLSEHPFLESLVLDGNAINGAFVYLAQMLSTNQHLKTLSLCQCQLSLIHAEDADFFAKVLKHNAALTSLNIDSNDVGAEFLTRFIEQVTSNNTLTHYQGPDDANGTLAKICNRNSMIPCNAPWSVNYNPSATPLDKTIGLILDTKPSNDATLLFIAGRNALKQQSFIPKPPAQATDLEQHLLDNTYAAAVEQTLMRPKSH